MFIDHRYKVLESLGTGTWANVYKVLDVRSGNHYTLKLFQYLSSESLYKYFKATDMHHVTKLYHPNLIHVVDFGHVGDHIYFISDYFEGGTLNNFQFKRNNINTLYDMIIQICMGLNALHKQNIIHRDIKPENILYRASSNNLEIKLIDYGFSRYELDKDSEYLTGTLPFIAPEVYMGKPADFASDFYSLGVLVYKIITGSYPYNLDQINALRSGSQHYFIPIFPSELNPLVPLHLEKLCLRLLEQNPTNRFASSEEILDYIYRTVGRGNPYSSTASVVNSVQHNSYLVRDTITQDLLEHLKLAEEENGRIVSLIGGEGLGKGNVLSLFRYNILKGSYFIFDYSCTRQDHEAVFALLKEYLVSLPDEQTEVYRNKRKMSDKLYQYLFDSETEAKALIQTSDELMVDFEFAKSLLIDLSKTKPVVFIIRDIQYVHQYTIDFLNYVSQDILNNRILVLLSCTEFNKINRIDHQVLINVPLFSYDESIAYMGKLLNTPIEETFGKLVYQRSSGNPLFIQEILIDMILRGIIITSGSIIRFPDNLDNYSLPSRLVHSVYTRMSHLTEKNYKHLQTLSIIQTPMSSALIRYVCRLTDSDLYALLNDAKFNELIEKRGNEYQFTYAEAKARFYNECSPKRQKLTSIQTLKFFRDKHFATEDIMLGLISNARIAESYTNERKYLIELYYYWIQENNHEKAYEVVSQVIGLDVSGKLEIASDDLAEDLLRFKLSSEFTGLLTHASIVIDSQMKITDSSEKNLLLGVIAEVGEDYKNALKYFKKAFKLTSSASLRSVIILYISEVKHMLGLEDGAGQLNDLNSDELALSDKIQYWVLKARYAFRRRDYTYSIDVLEKCLSQISPNLDVIAMYRLIVLHNDLGEYYSLQKNVIEAEDHFTTALSIVSRYSIKRFSAIIYNNLSELYLKQGYTYKAMTNAKLGFDVSTELNQGIVQARALLSQGEISIKLGEFEAAESYLLKAQELLRMLNSNRYSDLISSNMALAKSKIVGFGNYYQYVIKQEVRLVNDYLPDLRPLVKTYIYYLHETKNHQKLRRILRKNAHLDFQTTLELEFYHNIQSLLAIADRDYNTALTELKTASQYAGEVNSHYAIAVLNTLQSVCYYGLQNYAKAKEIIDTALPEIDEYQYQYWGHYMQLMSIKLELADPNIALRSIFRRLIALINACTLRSYFQLKTELIQIKIQILSEWKLEKEAIQEYEEYLSYLHFITEGMGEDDRKHYLKACQASGAKTKSFSFVFIASRMNYTKKKWNDLLFNISNVNSVQRVKFLIERGLSQVIAPYKFKLMVYSEKISNFYTFLCFNCPSDIMIPPEFTKIIEQAFINDTLTQFEHENKHTIIMPMQSGNKRVGVLLLSDDGELPFTASELTIIRNIKNHLTALIIRTWDYTEVTQKISKMKQLVSLSHDLMKILNMDDLELAVVSAAIDLTNCSRGFLIKKDSEGNNVYQVLMDHQKQLISSATGISKTALSIVQNSQEKLVTYNALLDNRFKSSVSVQDYLLHTIFCSPLLVNDTCIGYLYLDNYLDSVRELYLNEDIIALLINQIGNAINNSLQYSALTQKSTELNTLEQLKDEFISIVSHELNTPLTSLQGYISRLKRNLYSDEEEKNEIMSKLENSVTRLTTSITDITTMNLYNISTNLSKAPLDVAEVLELIHQEVSILSRKRHMQIKMEIELELPHIYANWTALHRMIYNIVLNAIRFTDEFGNVIIGARKSSFPQEKINNKDTLVIYVKDNGIGIPQFRQKEIFRKFFELNEIYAHKSGTIEYRSSGLGLGLSMSKRIAQLHGGEILIKSKEQEGTTVFMLLPFK